MQMQRSTIPAAALAALLTLAAAPAAAQGEWTSGWSNGHVLRSEDGRFDLKFGGRIQADWTFADVDPALGALEDGFEFRRARLFFSGTVYERVAFKAQYDFAGGDADFKDVWVGLLFDWGQAQFGHFKEPFSLEELTSSKYITFLERSLPIEAFAPSRNAGVGVHGASGPFTWGVGAFYDADDFGESVDEDDRDLTGRLVFRPLHLPGERLLHVGGGASLRDRGESLRFRARPENHLADRLVGTPQIPADGATVLGAELAGAFGPFWVASEVLRSEVDAALGADPGFGGAYVEAGWFLTGEHRPYKASSGTWDRVKPRANWGEGAGAWEVAVRWSTLDLSDAGILGGEQDDLTLGLNWYLNPATRLAANWVRADVEGRGEADFVALRWQVDF